MDEDEYGYCCDTCGYWHESDDDCPETFSDCPACKAEATVQTLRGPAPDDPDKAFCDLCDWEG